MKHLRSFGKEVEIKEGLQWKREIGFFFFVCFLNRLRAAGSGHRI